ncbi:hypothetical protein GCM10025771_14640 [Niveibacterium umoris]
MEIDVCAPCTLIWFDETESIRIAGPGLVELVKVIDASMRVVPTFLPMPAHLPCQVCGAPLKRVYNQTRYGRTAHLDCPAQHGTYQSFMLFLAEKGYFRPFEWADIQRFAAAGQPPRCSQCGATLDARPQHTCPYCASPVGVYDPARLARAIDRDEAAAPVVASPRAAQAACVACGGMVDLSRDTACPHCHALIRPSDTASAVAVSAEVAEDVARNHERQTPYVSRRKLEEGDHRVVAGAYDEEDAGKRRRRLFAMGLSVLASLGIWLSLSSVGIGFRSPIVVLNDDGSETRMSAREYEAIEARSRDRAQRGVDHGPAGKAPPQLKLQQRGEALVLTADSDLPLVVSVNLAYEQLRDAWIRCGMQLDQATPGNGRYAVLGTRGASASFRPMPHCSDTLRRKGRYEFIVTSGGRDIYKSDSAFFD